MKTINLSVLITLFALSNSFSQVRIDNELLNPFTLRNINKTNINDIKGTPYIQQDFAPALVDKIPGEHMSARYNAYSDDIEIKKGNEKFILNKKSEFSKIKFIATKIVYKAYNYIENDSNKRGYLAQLNPTGTTLLLKKQSILFIDAKTSKTGYDEGSPAQFKKVKDKYFIKINDNNIVELPKSKKTIAKLFPKYEKEILSYIKKQGINIKKEIDLIKLIDYVNTLK